MAFEVVVLLDVCEFEVNICGNLAVLVFNEDLKTW